MRNMRNMRKHAQTCTKHAQIAQNMRKKLKNRLICLFWRWSFPLNHLKCTYARETITWLQYWRLSYWSLTAEVKWMIKLFNFNLKNKFKIMSRKSILAAAICLLFASLTFVKAIAQKKYFAERIHWRVYRLC